MIEIIQGTSNSVVVTLDEKTTISNPYYLFSFTNVTTGLNKTFIGLDTSCNTERYNFFTVVEPTTVELTDPGQWDYIIYAQTSDSNLDPLNADETVETGMVKVIDPTASPDINYTLTETDIQYVE